MTEFLTVIDAHEAHRRFREAVKPAPLGVRTVGLADALGRVLAIDVASPVDVPGFDRSNVDGYAVRAEDTFGAEEASPRKLSVNAEEIATGVHPRIEVRPGTATRIATGGMIPRGADAVVMVEQTQPGLLVMKPLTPGANVSFAGSDIARGEIVLRSGTRLSARETGTLAALGVTAIDVFRRPRVAIFSTGNEIVAPGATMRPGLVYDSNLRILCDSVRELGCEPVDLGIVPDELGVLSETLKRALDCDAVLLSGGTSKGEGDLSVVAVRQAASVVCHGVALKPGKPLCLAVARAPALSGAGGGVERGKPVVVLPGFPTSAVFTFHEFVAPVLLAMAGAPPESAATVRARVPMRINTEKGRAEFVLVSLLDGPEGPAAYPMGKGSGSVTAFAKADGFVTLGRQQEFLEAGEAVDVRLLGRDVRAADLVVIGSHCVGLDFLLSLLRREGFTSKALVVGSQGGLLAAGRGECDLAGVHLCDEKGVYNTPFLKPGMALVRGYGRMQGVVFLGREPDVKAARMVNRNRGSGTRVLIDGLLGLPSVAAQPGSGDVASAKEGGARPPGYHFEAKSHNAVAAAVAQGRADWGVAIRTVAEMYGLGFRALREERYDFVVPEARRARPAVQAFERLLASDAAKKGLAALGFTATG